MKKLTVLVAALGWRDVERRNLTHIGELNFTPKSSCFPAVTCVAQASWRTGLTPREHGMVSNGAFMRNLMRPSFWEQSAALVQGPRIWDEIRTAGTTIGLFFLQQSLGEAADAIISPAPIHKHGGGMIMRNYTQPAELSDHLQRTCGTFPLHRYWGPLAAPSVGDAVINNFLAFYERKPCDWCALYLPTLDYDLQRFGPDHPRTDKSFTLLTRQLLRLQEFAAAHSMELEVIGDYAINTVTRAPAFPNRTLRTAGLFNVRPINSRAYPDFYTSRAFAMCDHEFAHVYVRRAEDIALVKHVLEASGDYETVEVRDAQEWAHPNAGEILIVAKEGSWCAYPWWQTPSEAPDWATHVDIHNKPGYDPCELFFGRLFPPGTCQDASRIKGTHGRRAPIARATLT